MSRLPSPHERNIWPTIIQLEPFEDADTTPHEIQDGPPCSRKRKGSPDGIQSLTPELKKPRMTKAIGSTSLIDNVRTDIGSNSSFERVLSLSTTLSPSTPVSPTQAVSTIAEAKDRQEMLAMDRTQATSVYSNTSSINTAVSTNLSWTPFTPASSHDLVLTSASEHNIVLPIAQDSKLAASYPPGGSMHDPFDSDSTWDVQDFPEDMIGDLPIAIEDLFPWDEGSTGLSDQWVFGIPRDILDDAVLSSLAPASLSPGDERVNATSTDEPAPLSLTPLPTVNDPTLSANERSYPPANFVLNNNPHTHSGSSADLATILDASPTGLEPTPTVQEDRDLLVHLYHLLGLEAPPPYTAGSFS